MLLKTRRYRGRLLGECSQPDPAPQISLSHTLLPTHAPLISQTSGTNGRLRSCPFKTLRETYLQGPVSPTCARSPRRSIPDSARCSRRRFPVAWWDAKFSRSEKVCWNLRRHRTIWTTCPRSHFATKLKPDKSSSFRFFPPQCLLGVVVIIFLFFLLSPEPEYPTTVNDAEKTVTAFGRFVQPRYRYKGTTNAVCEVYFVSFYARVRRVNLDLD